MKYISPSDPNPRLSVMVMVGCSIAMAIDAVLIYYDAPYYTRGFAIVSFGVLAMGMVFMLYSWWGWWRLEYMKHEREAIRVRRASEWNDQEHERQRRLARHSGERQPSEPGQDGGDATGSKR